MALTPKQIKAARALLGWNVDKLAEQTGVHRNTIINMEKGQVSGPVMAAAKVAMETGGVQFIERNGGGEGVRLATASEPVEILTGKHKATGHETGNG